MRIIKFRAWDDGQMIYHDQRFYDHKQIHVSNLINLSKFFSIIREDAIVMQFTGLHDKNGKEIYEGDLIKSPFTEDIVSVIYDQEFCQFTFGGAEFGVECRANDVEVLGNIYENPELLK